MNSGTMRFICSMLIVSLVMLPFKTVQAGMIGADQIVTAAQTQAARAAVSSFVSRAEVAGQLQALGLTAQGAKDRVAVLTDTEVAQLAAQIDSLPAGASPLGSLIILIAVIFAVLFLVNMK